MLGRCLEAQGWPREAEGLYREALRVAELVLSGNSRLLVEGGLEQTDNVKRQMGVCHTDLADVLRDQGRYAEAEGEYEAGLKLAKETNDDRQQAVVLGQLGTISLTQRKYPEARRRYAEALAIFQRMGEDQMEAVAWHQLGRVAQEERDWDEAERCYKESLGIEERLGNLAGAAQTANQLAIVAKHSARPAEAERWYLRAIELKEKHSTPSDLASSLNNLANLYLSLNRLDEAETCAHKARAIKETLDLSSQPWNTYNILAQIAEKKGDPAAARAWRRVEQETFAAFPGHSNYVEQWQQEIAVVVAACQGNAEAREAAKKFIAHYKGKDDWRNLANRMELILNGQKGDELYDDLDRIDALIVRVILNTLSGEQSPSSFDQQPGVAAQDRPQPSPQRGEGATPPRPDRERGSGGEGMTLPQLFELVERAVSSGDQQLGGQLFGAFQQMSSDTNAPLEVRELFKVFVLILIGDKSPTLDALQTASPDLASAVRGWWDDSATDSTQRAQKFTEGHRSFLKFFLCPSVFSVPSVYHLLSGFASKSPKFDTTSNSPPSHPKGTSPPLQTPSPPPARPVRPPKSGARTASPDLASAVRGLVGRLRNG